jgi:putative NADH-flavin reductase
MGLILLVSCLVGLVVLYLYHVNRGMSEVPEEARLLSPHRWTVDQVKAAYKKSTEAPVDVTRHLPPKQQRRYIVVGGSGSLTISPIPETAPFSFFFSVQCGTNYKQKL